MYRPSRRVHWFDAARDRHGSWCDEVQCSHPPQVPVAATMPFASCHAASQYQLPCRKRILHHLIEALLHPWFANPLLMGHCYPRWGCDTLNTLSTETAHQAS